MLFIINSLTQIKWWAKSWIYMAPPNCWGWFVDLDIEDDILPFINKKEKEKEKENEKENSTIMSINSYESVGNLLNYNIDYKKTDDLNSNSNRENDSVYGLCVMCILLICTIELIFNTTY